VCDGFVGNALLKAYESFYSLAESMLEKEPKLLMKIKEHISIIDPENYGAVPFLGIRGTVLKAHGGSSPRAIANAIITAITAVNSGAVWLKNVRPKGN
jgi:glycerol-3-phosphate acyltransferase PlsX